MDHADKSTPRRTTKTIAIPHDLHDLLRIAALQESLRTKRRITLQDCAETALRSYLDQINSPDLARKLH